ncbi:MAG TPA: ABC transporter substrate-binding protein [Candidatus Baltobacteraceae bacterium]|nr:ABC transporter substrate-binding protein [Candidatus Baltobacteraceae bacterium]
MRSGDLGMTRRDVLKLGAAGMAAAGLGPLGCSRGDSKDQVAVSRPEELQKLDASDQYNLVNYTLNLHLFDTLVEMDESGKYVPSLAEAWETSPDGLAWTFKLRKGVKFHNGDRFTSKSVKFTLERMKDRKLARSNFWTELDTVDTPDDSTAIVRTLKPVGPMLANLITPTAMYSEKQAEKDGPTFYEKLIGTGPYKFVEWKKSEKFVMDLFPDHWRQPLPKIKQITYRPIMEDSTRMSDLRTGALAMADTVPPDQVKVLQGDDKLQVLRVMAWDQLYLGLKCDQSPFDKVEGRQALNYAIDRQGIVDKIMEGGRPASAIVPQGMIGYADNLKPYAYDPEKAKSLLAAAGWKGGKLRFIAPQGWYPKIKEVTEAIASQFKAVGMDTDLTVMEGAAFTKARGAGEYNIYITGGASWDPDTMLDQRVRNDIFKSGYKNQKVFDLILEGRTTVDQAKRGEIYKAAQDILYVEGPMAWLFQMEAIYGMKKSLKGFIAYPFKVWDLRKAEIV